MWWIIIAIIILIKLILCYNMLLNHPKAEKVKYSEIEQNCKTGDLILFHGLDNINGIFIGCYFTHIGIVYRESSYTRPYIFEAWNPKLGILYPQEISNGIAFTDLENRLNSYRGYVFYKPLEMAVLPIVNAEFYKFIYTAVKKMKYNNNVIQNGINKLLFNDQLRIGTNCGELVYLSLMKLGIIKTSNFHINRKHHLREMCYLEDTDTGNKYLPISYVWQNYFIL